MPLDTHTDLELHVTSVGCFYMHGAPSTIYVCLWMSLLFTHYYDILKKKVLQIRQRQFHSLSS